ncbi:hypothetical protein [Rubritalea tangerina]|uniref:PEP-CTERM sorting domain-containing protein n=1 Tax=Rubritalea tangerina TaxID=430798 RepID=A0ABW4Z6A4_9BACT
MKLHTLLLATTLLHSSLASAAVIQAWDNDASVHGSETWTSNYHALGLTSTNITTGAGITAKTSSGGPGATSAMKYTELSSSISSFTSANNANAYLSWTTTAHAGYQFSVDSLQLATVNLNNGNPTLIMELRSSADGFASTLDTTKTAIGDASLGIQTFSNLAITQQTQVEWRLYTYWDPTDSPGASSYSIHFRNDKTSITDFPDATGLVSDPIVLLNGSVTAVPEPTATTLIALAGLPLVLRRKR